MAGGGSLKPKTINRTLNSVRISWENVFCAASKQMFALQIQTFCKEWKTLYRGFSNHFFVDNLAPCTYYNFRIKASEEEWIYFKSATDSITTYVFHLTQAVKFSNIPRIRKIVTTRPVLLNTENKEGKTPLIQAIENKNLQVVGFLLSLGANVNQATLISQKTPVMFAISDCNIQIVNILMDKGANLTEKDCIGRTILHYAVDSNILANVEFCLSLNLDINAEDNKGWSPLLRAVLLNCSDEIIQILLKNGAKTTTKDNYGFDFNKHLELSERTLKDTVELPLEDEGLLTCSKN